MTLPSDRDAVNAPLRRADPTDAAELATSTTVTPVLPTQLAEVQPGLGSDRSRPTGAAPRPSAPPWRWSSSWRVPLGESRLVDARLEYVGPRYTREVWMVIEGRPHTQLGDDEDPAPYGRGYVDQLLLGMERRGGCLLVERRRYRSGVDGPARGGWVAVLGGDRRAHPGARQHGARGGSAA